MGEYVGLRDIDLQGSVLIGMNFAEADFSEVDLSEVDLRWADLRGADLSYADLSEANLRSANLRGANLRKANLNEASLMLANLQHADLTDAVLTGVDLRYANLSGVTGLLDPAEWLFSQFESTVDGLLVYKAFGDTQFPRWTEAPAGTVCEELGVNPDRCTVSGSGVNFGTLEFCRTNYQAEDFQDCEIEIWKCLIRWKDISTVVVPYATDGGARCARLTKIELALTL